MAPKASQDKTSTEPTIVLDITFDLTTLNQPTPLPALSKGERTRARALVRALLNDADRNNDGALIGTEIERLIPFREANAAAITMLSKAMETENRQTIQEFSVFSQPSPEAALIPLVRPVLPSQMIVADYPLINANLLAQSLAEAHQLPLADVQKLVRRVLPKGVEEITAAQECARDEALPCAPLPKGQIAILAHPKRGLD